MSRWEVKDKPELIPVPIDEKRYQQLLAEIAHVLYKVFVDAQKKKASSSQGEAVISHQAQNSRQRALVQPIKLRKAS